MNSALSKTVNENQAALDSRSPESTSACLGSCDPRRRVLGDPVIAQRIRSAHLRRLFFERRIVRLVDPALYSLVVRVWRRLVARPSPGVYFADRDRSRVCAFHRQDRRADRIDFLRRSRRHFADRDLVAGDSKSFRGCARDRHAGCFQPRLRFDDFDPRRWHRRQSKAGIGLALDAIG